MICPTGCTDSADHDPTGMAAESDGAVVPQDVSGVCGVEYPQAYPQGGVGADRGGDGALGPLGGQNEVDPQAASLGGDAHQSLQDLGVVAGQRSEFVNRYHQVGDDDPRR